MSSLFDYLGDFGDGIVTTVELTGASFVAATLIATVVVSCRISPVRPLRLFGTAYVELFQNIPLLLWIALVFFALPEIGIKFEPFTSVVVATGLYAASYYAEALRSGVNSVSKGQAEAARALGLGFGKSLGHVILPQALRSTIQPLTNVTITLLMETAFAATVGVLELTETANRVNFELADPILVYVGAGICYAALALAIAGIGGTLERRLVIVR